MASFISAVACRPFSTACRSVTPTLRLPQMCERSRTFGAAVSAVTLSSKPAYPRLPRLSEHILSSTCSRHYILSRQSFGSRNLGSRQQHTGHRISKSPLLETHCRPISFSARLLAKKTELVTIHFINRDREKITVKASTGQNLLDTVVDNDLDIDGYGACEGTLSCSTCHLIFEEDMFKVLPKPSDEELDMLDLAYGQTDMSRLGCQVILTKEMDGMTVVVPEGVADARDP